MQLALLHESQFFVKSVVLFSHSRLNLFEEKKTNRTRFFVNLNELSGFSGPCLGFKSFFDFELVFSSSGLN